MTAPALRILPPAPVTHCMPWHLRCDCAGIHGARCCGCNREVAAPAFAKGKHVACIYCGFESGAVPCVEIDPMDEEQHMLCICRRSARLTAGEE